MSSKPTSVRIIQGSRMSSATHYSELCVKSSVKNVETRKLNHGVCIPPIFGNIKPKDVLEFIELNRLLGAEKFMFYLEISDKSVSSGVLRVLEYYQSIRVVHIHTWELPFERSQIWYHGQSLAINDCLYRYMNDFHHLTFVDLDEFIIPKGDLRSWGDMLPDLKKQSEELYAKASAFSFKTAFFSPEFSRHVYSNELNTVIRVNRTFHFSYRRHKLMVLPERVFELGIHHVSRAWPDGEQFRVVHVPLETAFVHHYRACVQEFGIHCNARSEDSTVLNIFGTQLQYNVLKIMSDITF
ncbi:beta-1,4-galactosyltransferase galt-1-like [Dreissena polymorpha]|nr:beta-1,4-galactosyltransferase galt-1-like [Dreissena polymorpha]